MEAGLRDNPVRLWNFATGGRWKKITDTELGVGGSHRIDVGFPAGVVFFLSMSVFSMSVSLKSVSGK